MASAQAGGAATLLSEDVQDGFRWRGITVLDLFGPAAETALFG